MIRTGAFSESLIFHVRKCNHPMDFVRRFWHKNISCILSQLCKQQQPFTEMIECCFRAKNALLSDEPDTLSDYYDCALFKRDNGSRMSQRNSNTSLYEFLWFSNAGGEIVMVE